ncbi:hypothetical protein SI65_03042 [Aspergillus cristatus]|uniref:thioredoxin-dependent peroxiredoxin n=1 Tax=Aspergillus cristatus TaxID=573508 RepID=A0A1E3BP85_ASPCR|nr:hypothetical protein SI65_03042 [Aspergillus cristatus]
MVELRKRKASAQPNITETNKRGKKEEIPTSDHQTGKTNDTTNADSLAGVPNVGDTIALDGFGGEIQTNDGTKTNLKELVATSKSGVVLFTYPRASTPGCTKQACLFRDKYGHLTSTGLSIYGLSTDSPKANTTFRFKQTLPYPLLCDASAVLISAIGFKKVPKGTIRGVFSVDKQGKVLLRQAGGPDATVDAVQKLVQVEGTPKTDVEAQAKNEN